MYDTWVIIMHVKCTCEGTFEVFIVVFIYIYVKLFGTRNASDEVTFNII